VVGRNFFCIKDAKKGEIDDKLLKKVCLVTTSEDPYGVFLDPKDLKRN
jgi:hypothetical protein